MARTSKRKSRAGVETALPERIKRDLTAIYARLSIRDGGHGREDTLETQKQICIDFIKKHPEMDLVDTYADNGVSGTTFARPEFERLMADIKSGRINCIVVKDFSRFGRDALDAVDLIDVIFPTLGVRFLSVLDEYDSENPACSRDRVTHILTHFMNDYYAREVSAKLVQAHRQSREKGEYWGGRPPYGYERSETDRKSLVPLEDERKVVRDIFNWYVIDGETFYQITRKLNKIGIPSPAESYEKRKYGACKKEKKYIWRQDIVRTIILNPAYVGIAAYGKTKRMLAENIPFQLIPREEWEMSENAWESLVDKSMFDKAQEINLKQWREWQEARKKGSKRTPSADGPFIGKIYCGCCGNHMARINSGSEKTESFTYFCSVAFYTENEKCVAYVREDTIMEAVSASLRYQISLAKDFKRKHGDDFYSKLKEESELRIKRMMDKSEKYNSKIAQLYE
ncbi:MAG: recombinase family protein, partial [Lachnospiraceae bacterium]|nr:recombinase family protein [Lachnospiraceae bacterium]